MMLEYRKCGHKEYHESHLHGTDPTLMGGGTEYTCLGYDNLWGKEDV